jgi:hypothetical protein
VTVDRAGNVALGIVNPGFRSLVVNDRGARLHRIFRIEDGRQEVVVDGKLAAAFLCGRLAVGNDCGDALADEAHNPVEHRGVVRIDDRIFVPGARIEVRRRVFVSQNRPHAGNGQRLAPADRSDAGVGVGRTQELEMQQSRRRRVHRIMGATANDGACGRRGHAAAARRTGFGCFDLAHTADGIFDRAISGAAANVALQGPFEILLLRLVEARGRDDHARRAETTLESLRLQKGFLYRVQFAVPCQAFNRRDGAALDAEGWKQTGMHRLAVDHHRARPAVPGVAALLDAETAELAQQCPQALARSRLCVVALSIHQKNHDAPALLPSNSRRISSANCCVTCRRQAGDP